MGGGRSAVHAPVDETRARCGWLYVQTSNDQSKVTCKSCLRLLNGKRPPKGLAESLGAALSDSLQPSAGPPPLLDAYTWPSVCRLDPDTQAGRCGHCPICTWEREAERYAAVAPWADSRLRVDRDPDRPVFGSLNAALVALAEWRAHDRHAQSALGPMLDRIKAGQTGGGGPRGKPTRSKLLDRADDIAHVDQALREAYRAGDNPAYLPPHLAEWLTLVRAPGVVRGGAPTYVEIAERLQAQDWVATPRQLKRTVRAGRRSVSVELAARGLIREPKAEAGLAEAIWKRRVELGAVEEE